MHKSCYRLAVPPNTDKNRFACIHGTLHLLTFLDAGFADSYEVGEDNCGFPTDRTEQKLFAETENERLMLNGETYVHWYDCITDYVL